MKTVSVTHKAILAFFLLDMQYAGAQYVATDSMFERQIDEVAVISNGIEAQNRVGTVREADAMTLKATGSVQVSDALKFMSGAMVKDYGGIGGLKTVSVRGLASEHTAVVYDGVLVSDDQSGQIDLGRFSVSQTESLQLGSGPDNDMMKPASVAALSSRVSISSKSPKLEEGENCRSEASVTSGSFGTWNLNARTGFRMGRKSALWAGADWLETEGDYPFMQMNAGSSKVLKRSNSQVERMNLSLSYERTMESGRLTASVNWYGNEQNYPSNILYLERASAESLKSGIFGAQAVWRQRAGELFTFETQLKFNDNTGRYHNLSTTDVAGHKDNEYRESGFYISEVALCQLAERIQAVAAADVRFSSMYGSQLVNSDPERITANASIGTKYASERLVFTGRMNMVHAMEKTGTGNNALDYTKLSPSVGANFLLWPEAGLHVRASYQQAVRLPSFNDLYFEQAGRRNLKPEVARMSSAGIAMSHDLGSSMTIELYADSYTSRVSDRILAVPGKNTAVWRMENVGKVLTHGLETGVSAHAVFFRELSVSFQASYTYQRCMDKSDSDPAVLNHQLPYMPRHSASALLIVETGIVDFSWSSLFSGEYYSNRYNGPEYRMPGYSDSGISVWRNFHLSDKCSFELRGQVMNLFDKQYEIVKNFPMPGRQYRLSASFDF